MIGVVGKSLRALPEHASKQDISALAQRTSIQRDADTSPASYAVTTSREWRQQLLVLGLLTMAVAATIWSASVVTNVQLRNPDYATYGTAAALVTLPGTDPHLAADIAAIPSLCDSVPRIGTGTTTLRCSAWSAWSAAPGRPPAQPGG